MRLRVFHDKSSPSPAWLSACLFSARPVRLPPSVLIPARPHVAGTARCCRYCMQVAAASCVVVVVVVDGGLFILFF